MTVAVGQVRPDAHRRNANGNGSGGPANVATTPTGSASAPRAFAELRLLAESFEDVQKSRNAIENRLRSGSDEGPVTEALESLRHAEAKLSLAMRRCFRRAAPEVARWAKQTPGLGVSSDHLMARLLGTTGHPVIASPYHWQGEGSERVLVADEPYLRSVSQWWSYCGHGDPTRRRRKGMTSEEAFALGNPRAKMLTRLIAVGCMRCVGSANTPSPSKRDTPDRPNVAEAIEVSAPAEGAPPPSSADGASCAAISTAIPPRRRSPYRDIYEFGRSTYDQREDWTDAHRHNAALRLVGKEVLRDLWKVANEALQEANAPAIPGTAPPPASTSPDGGAEAVE